MSKIIICAILKFCQLNNLKFRTFTKSSYLHWTLFKSTFRSMFCTSGEKLILIYLQKYEIFQTKKITDSLHYQTVSLSALYWYTDLEHENRYSTFPTFTWMRNLLSTTQATFYLIYEDNSSREIRRVVPRRSNDSKPDVRMTPFRRSVWHITVSERCAETIEMLLHWHRSGSPIKEKCRKECPYLPKIWPGEDPEKDFVILGMNKKSKKKR